MASRLVWGNNYGERGRENSGGELSAIPGHKSTCTYRIASESFLYIPFSSQTYPRALLSSIYATPRDPAIRCRHERLHVRLHGRSLSRISPIDLSNRSHVVFTHTLPNEVRSLVWTDIFKMIAGGYGILGNWFHCTISNSRRTKLDSEKYIFSIGRIFIILLLIQKSPTSKAIRKNSLRPNDAQVSNQIESNRHSRYTAKLVRWFKGIFFRPRFDYPLVVKHRIATLRSLCRGTVIDSSLVTRNATGERVYTHTIARQTRSHAQNSSPVEMKLRRGVDIPPAPLLNWNLIARPRCSITSCVFSAPMQIIGCTRVSLHATPRHAMLPPLSQR